MKGVKTDIGLEATIGDCIKWGHLRWSAAWMCSSWPLCQRLSLVSVIGDCCDEWCNCMLYLTLWYAIRAQCHLSDFDHMGNSCHSQVDSQHSPCCLTWRFQDASCHWSFFPLLKVCLKVCGLLGTMDTFTKWFMQPVTPASCDRLHGPFS